MSEQKDVEQPPENSQVPVAGGDEEEQYPETAKKPKKNYEIDIFRGWCKSCGICAAFCPKHCITLDENGSPAVEDSEQCSGCGWCEIHCPDFAISVRQTKSPRIVAEDE
ncbi:MAG: ATP-binding protein [Syntrophobacteraceae bacterium]